MNKREVDQEITAAYQALTDTGIVNKGKIDSAYSSQIASFGAAVAMGSLLSAIAFFSTQGKALVERQKLMDAILWILKQENKAPKECRRLFDYASTHGKEGKENIMNAAVALKLAMNLYEQE